jgi:hypothetical protein
LEFWISKQLVVEERVAIMVHSEHHNVMQNHFPHVLEQLTKGLGGNRVLANIASLHWRQQLVNLWEHLSP